MAFKSSIKLDSALFDKTKRRAAFSSVVTRTAKDFKNLLRRKMVESNPSGRIDNFDDTRRGRGFVRRFRRSRRGERPAIETTTLLNAIEDRKTGELSAIVEIADRRNPNNGESAKDYADKLQNDKKRKIMVAEDIETADRLFKARSQITLDKLL